MRANSCRMRKASSAGRSRQSAARGWSSARSRQKASTSSARGAVVIEPECAARAARQPNSAASSDERSAPGVVAGKAGAAADRQLQRVGRPRMPSSASTASAACSAKARNVVHLPPTMQNCGTAPSSSVTKWPREMRPVKSWSLRGSGRMPL